MQHNPFHAAFGGEKKDLTAYSRAGFPEGRTYLVNDKGEVQTSHIVYKKSFGELNELLNEVFPPYDGSCSIYVNDFCYICRCVSAKA